MPDAGISRQRARSRMMATGILHCGDFPGLAAGRIVAAAGFDRSIADTMGRYPRDRKSGLPQAVPDKKAITDNRLAAGMRSAGFVETVETSNTAGARSNARRPLAEVLRRCVMLNVRSTAFALSAACSAWLAIGMALPVKAQSALDAAQELAA